MIDVYRALFDAMTDAFDVVLGPADQAIVPDELQEQM